MSRALTLLVSLGLVFAGILGSPPAAKIPVEHEGLAVTQLVVEMTSGGLVKIRGWPGHGAKALGDVMRTACEALPLERLEALKAATPQGRDELFAGWLRVHVDPETRFEDVWPLFLGPERDHSVFRFAFDATASTSDGSPLFVEMPYDWGLQCGLDVELDPPVWLILSDGSGEFGPLFGKTAHGDGLSFSQQERIAQGRAREGVRHALGNYMGSKTMTVGAYFDSATEARLACAGVRPHLVVEADVPWREVEPVLLALSQGGTSWWPVLASEISKVTQR